MMRVATYVAVTVIYFSVGLSKIVPRNHSGWDVVNQFECGDSAADRIIGGKNAMLGEFPWIARLGYFFPDDNRTDWMCGGTLITDRHIVTAAHCIPSPEDDYYLTSVLLGEHNTLTDPDCQLTICAPKVQARSVKYVLKHEKFNDPPFHNDMAVLVLDKPVELNDFVAPICLPQEDNKLNIGELVTAAGWGTMNMSTEERATILQVVALPVVDPILCDMFGQEFKVSNSEICAGSHYNKDACGGDSGGPLMKVYDTLDGPKYYLVGVVSFGPSVCGIKKPGVYSSVMHFLEWILNNVAKKQ